METPTRKNTSRKKRNRRKAFIIELVLSVLALFAISFLPTLHLYVNNVGDLKLGDLMGSVYIFAGVGLALFAILRLIFRRKPYFAGCMTALILFLIVNFSLVSSPFKLFIQNYVVANIVAIVFMALLIAGGWFLFSKLCQSKQNGRGILTVFTIVFVGLIAFNGIQLLFAPKATASVEADDEVLDSPAPTMLVAATATPAPTDSAAANATPAPTDPDATPDPSVPASTPEPVGTPEPTPTPFVLGEPNIYLLLFDEYGAMGAMEKYYNYDCTPMREFMRAAGINWSEYSYSMTNETKYSVTDLNMMDYVSYKKSEDTLKSYRQKSTLKKVFGTELGYKLYQYSESATWFGFITSLRDKEVRAQYQETIDGVESDQIVTSQSLWGAFQSIFGSLTPQSKINGKSESLQQYGYYSSVEIKASEAFKKHEYRTDAGNILDILDFYDDPNNFMPGEKRAIFTYITCPHVPFFFDEFGQIRPYAQRMNWNDPDYYRSQYIFITKHIVNIFKTIISADPNSIIIVMSDHGVRDHHQGFTKISDKDNCWTFLAVYYCGQPLDIEGMSYINVMRLIATNLGYEMPPVEDYITVDSADDLSDVNFNR